MVPRQRRDTMRPVRPSLTYCMGPPGWAPPRSPGRVELAEELLAKVTRGDGALLHKEHVEGLERELLFEQPLRLLAQREDLIPAQAVGDGLGGPLRVAVQRPLRRGAA